ncbi:hypothetical protein ACOME3_003591 [Neoechinorhynchus agilis]
MSLTVIALKCKTGVVLASENILTSKLYEPNSFSRMFKIDRHVGLVAGGFLSDAREIAEVARNEAADMKKWTGNPVPLKALSERVSMYMHAYTLYGRGYRFKRTKHCPYFLIENHAKCVN